MAATEPVADPLIARCVDVCTRMRASFVAADYKGIDPYLLDAKLSRFRSLPLVGPLVSWARMLMKPFHAAIPKAVFTSCEPMVFPKALGLILSGTAMLARHDPSDDKTAECANLSRMLGTFRSPGFKHAAWGQPFAWGGVVRYPPHTPAVCVTTPIAHGLLDHYEVTQHTGSLELALSVAEYLRQENGLETFGPSLCFHYSPNNRDLAYNSNAMAGSFLVRLGRLREDAALVQMGMSALRFVVEGQNPDGSWYYTDPRGATPLDKTIDQRHSGFVLEHLTLSRDLVVDGELRTLLDASVERGLRYYDQVLFEGAIPRWAPEQTYPVDIHDVAQGILTPVAARQLDFARRVIEWAFESMFDGHESFFYKRFADGTVNRTVFLRWGQAWMFKALASYCAAMHDSRRAS